jgi:hypothetical protein
MVRIPQLDGLTQARHLREADLMAREWIAATTGAPLEDVAVEVTVDRVDDVPVARRLAAISAERAKAAALDRKATADAAALAAAMAARGVSLRDIGAALGVSFQRAHQLVKAAREAAPAG